MSQRDKVFRGRLALVTGASSGIGEGLARGLARRGADLVLVARRGTHLETLAEQFRAEHGVQVTVVPKDLSQPNSAQELCEHLERLNLKVDHLFNNAGRGLAAEFSKSDVGEELGMLRLNVEAPLVLVRQLLPPMLSRGFGGVVNVSSIAGMVPIPGMANYGATKTHVLSWTRALREELRGTGVHVMALCPGPVVTEFQATAGFELGALERLAAVPARKVAEIALQHYAAGRALSSPGAITTLLRFLTAVVPQGLAARVTGAVLRKRRQSRGFSPHKSCCAPKESHPSRGSNGRSADNARGKNTM